MILKLHTSLWVRSNSDALDSGKRIINIKDKASRKKKKVIKHEANGSKNLPFESLMILRNLNILVLLFKLFYKNYK